jgi:TRAP-type transport system periplasmic protein
MLIKKIWVLFLSLLLLFSLSGTVMGNEVVSLKFGHIANTDNSWHLAAVRFAELVNIKTNGEVEVKVYPNSQLGSERETIEGIPLGLCDITISADSLANWAPSIALQSHMYTFRDSEHIEKFQSSEVAEKIRSEILNKAGLRVIAWFERGPRYLTSNRPIRSLEDLKGFKIRVPDVPMFIKDWEACGTSPTPIAFGEVFSALQQGVIDGQENPLALIHSAKFYEVQKYVNRTAHVLQSIFVVIGEEKFKSLSDKNQQAVLEAALEMQGYERALFLAAEKELEDELKAYGVEFVDDVDIEGFKKAVENVIEDNYPEYLEDYKKIQTL